MKLHELGIEAIYSVPYQPEYNPAEAVFSKIKNYYKRRKLNILVNEHEIDWYDLVEEAVNVVTK